jgi:hypothetical protein
MLEDTRMIADFTDFVTWTYCVVDAIWQRLAPLFARSGPTPVCSDSKFITMAIVGQ